MRKIKTLCRLSDTDLNQFKETPFEQHKPISVQKTESPVLKPAPSAQPKLHTTPPMSKSSNITPQQIPSTPPTTKSVPISQPRFNTAPPEPVFPLQPQIISAPQNTSAEKPKKKSNLIKIISAIAGVGTIH